MIWASARFTSYRATPIRLINLLAGFARRFEESLINYIETFEEKSLLTEYEDIKESYHKSTDNFLYFVLAPAIYRKRAARRAMS